MKIPFLKYTRWLLYRLSIILERINLFGICFLKTSNNSLKYYISVIFRHSLFSKMKRLSFFFIATNIENSMNKLISFGLNTFRCCNCKFRTNEYPKITNYTKQFCLWYSCSLFKECSVWNFKFLKKSLWFSMYITIYILFWN